MLWVVEICSVAVMFDEVGVLECLVFVVERECRDEASASLNCFKDTHVSSLDSNLCIPCKNQSTIVLHL